MGVLFSAQESFYLTISRDLDPFIFVHNFLQFVSFDSVI